MEQFIVPLILGVLAYVFTTWAYKRELKDAQSYTHLLKTYRDLLIEEGESQKAGDGHGA